MNKWIKWGVVAVIGLVVLSKLAGGGKDAPPASAPAAAPAADAPAAEPTEAPKAKGLTLAQFEAIPSGATYDEVVALIGEPKATISESEIMGVKSAMYQWEGAALASNMTAMFSDGKMVTKSQFGLK